ncbi:BEM_HP_G0078700.mRNA.1.CDS.1 [Saccharomyces cerevisiae]|nr:BEM_HP_G0078700.mRNA.1.CDS.1 [Saccharomyces cerevisiae]CAI6990688.1 BEM_HP_G0078700.mRNA.1.CDS.1 [Saccharomyces cerevisiae]
MSINALLYVLSLALLIWTGSVVTLLLLLFFCLFLLFFSLHFFCFTREHVHYTLPPKCHSLEFRFDSIPSSSLSLSPFPFLFFPRLRAVAFASPTLSFFFSHLASSLASSKKLRWARLRGQALATVTYTYIYIHIHHIS